MTIRIAISDSVRAKLQERAAASGQSEDALAAQILEQAVLQPSIDEVLAPVRADFDASGMSDDQLSDLLERVKHDLRAVRHTRKAS